MAFATYRPLRGTVPAPTDATPAGAQRRNAEKLLKEIFEIEELAVLLDGSAIAIYNSGGGGVFGKLADGTKFGMNERPNGYLASRLGECPQALRQTAPDQQADVDVNGTVYCLTLAVPPMTTNAAWAITARSAISSKAHRPIAARIAL